jgi:hypothetical protein
VSEWAHRRADSWATWLAWTLADSLVMQLGCPREEELAPSKEDPLAATWGRTSGDHWVSRLDISGMRRSWPLSRATLRQHLHSRRC